MPDLLLVVFLGILEVFDIVFVQNLVGPVETLILVFGAERLVIFRDIQDGTSLVLGRAIFFE